MRLLPRLVKKQASAHYRLRAYLIGLRY